MKSRWMYTTVVALAVLLAMVAEPRVSAAQGRADATLYELTENMYFDKETRLRTATAALQGTAAVGTPLCPDSLMALLVEAGLIQRPKPCTVTAIGNDLIDGNTGGGTLSGRYAVVVEADNPVDHPELVVMMGSFEGTMQVMFDSAWNPLPVIAIPHGTMTPETVFGYPALAFGIGQAEFGGVFRLPFTMGKRGEKGRARRSAAAFYLSEDGRPERVKSDELSLGMPTVRVEIQFK
ncbi:MAG: hypothetical protein ACREJG_13090 [Candidatus Rokuibacteriota bacterium]